jgi:hypothetical protein
MGVKQPSGGPPGTGAEPRRRPIAATPIGTALVSNPMVNRAAPLFGAAFMVHDYSRLARANGH